jgi:hypothetical protein
MTGFIRFRQYGYVLIALLLLSAAASSASARDWADKPWLNKAGPLPGDGRTIRIGTAHGTSFIAYVNGPEDADTGVLLIHDRWGINRHVTAWADRLAGQGYRVLAVDLYDGREVQKEALADFVWGQIDPVWIEANLNAALRFLGQQGNRSGARTRGTHARAGRGARALSRSGDARDDGGPAVAAGHRLYAPGRSQPGTPAQRPDDRADHRRGPGGDSRLSVRSLSAGRHSATLLPAGRA